MIATRLMTQMGAGHVAVLVLACGLIAPFVAALVRESREDARRACAYGLAILALVLALMVSLDASGVPHLEACWACDEGLTPRWLCWVQGCW